MRLALQLFGLQFVSYFLIVANTRAYTQGNYTATAITDLLFAAQNYASIRLMVSKEPQNTKAFFGYVMGGTCGSLLSIWATVWMFGK